MTNASAETGGKLYVVATPIGNLADLGQRAAEVLARVTLVAAEDTRRSGKLLAHLGLKKEQLALHEHNESSRIASVLDELQAGRDVALVSDAGTPLISDPGLRLVQAAAAAGIEVIAVPGPSAVSAALSVAGLPTDRFTFEGFLPRRAGQRQARLEALGSETRTMVFFEAPHRIEAALAAMIDVFGAEREAVLARELTKLHEQVVRGSLSSLQGLIGQQVPALGEFVLVVAGRDEGPAAADADVLSTYQVLLAELAPAKAVAMTAKLTGRSRNEVYALTRA